MDASIIVAIISGIVTIITTVITVMVGMRKASQQMAVSIAVSDTKIEELTREVREHNDFAKRVPVLEEKMKVANNRIADLEKEVQKNG